MDKSSPVYENFSNKMEAMSGKPKINRTTFKIGSGDLTQRVTNNERKITLLKNIFKTQKIEIGEKITPKVNTLEESLMSTTQILGVISQKLQLDMDQRIKEQKAAFQNQRKLNQADKRDTKEEELEAKRKSNIVKKLGKATIKPFVGIFDQLKQLGLILGTGIIGTNLMRLLKDEDFQEKLQGIYNWTTKNWKSIAIAGGILVGLKLGFTLFKVFKFLKLAVAVLSSPVLLKTLAIAALTFGVFKLLTNKSDIIKGFFDKREKKVGEVLNEEDPTVKKNLLRLRRLIDPQGVLGKKSTSDKKFIRFLENNFVLANQPDEEKVKAYRELMSLSNLELYKKFQKEEGSSGLPFFIPDLSSFLSDKQALEREYKKLLKNKTIPPVKVIDGGTVDLRKNNKIKEFKQNNLPATDINTIASMNVLNPYMEQVPKLFGFSDLVYN
jgi:hypothetical protein